MYAVSAGIGVLTLTGVLLVGTAPEGADGSPTGFRADLGGVLLLVNLVLAAAVAFLVRRPGATSELPGVARELARRERREQYRRLVADDPAIARGIGVGRPDLHRDFDDGGLLDLNSVPVDRLTGLLLPEEAARVEEARRHLGRFSSLDEVAVYAELGEQSVQRLRDLAVFL
jgi:hypothetical protein